MTPELLEARNQKMKFYKILAKNPTAYNRQVFKEFKNSYNRKIRARKKEYYSELLNIHQGDTKKCWEVTKEAAGLSSKTNKAFTDKIVLDNNIVTGENNIANIFNNHFTTIANSISERIQPSDTSPDSFPEETEHRFSMQNITPAQIIEVVKNMQNKKSSDFTGLLNTLCVTFLIFLYNLVLCPPNLRLLRLHLFSKKVGMKKMSMTIGLSPYCAHFLKF
jgi:hypothetical protein